MLPSLIGSTSIRIKSSLELAGTASVWHWVSFWCLLTGATHATSTLLITWHSKKKKSYNEVKITSQQHWQRWTSYTHFTPCPFTTITKKNPEFPAILLLSGIVQSVVFLLPLLFTVSISNSSKAPPWAPKRTVVGWPWLATRCLWSHFMIPLLNRTGEANKTKNSWVKLKVQKQRSQAEAKENKNMYFLFLNTSWCPATA